MLHRRVSRSTQCFLKRHITQGGQSSTAFRSDFKDFNKGALGALSESGCGPFAATPIFLKIETCKFSLIVI